MSIINIEKKKVFMLFQRCLANVWQLCKKYNCSKTQLALSYILSYPEVSVIIPGIRTPEHVQLNTEGLFLLEPADRVFIENLGSSSFVSLMEMIQRQG